MSRIKSNVRSALRREGGKLGKKLLRSIAIKICSEHIKMKHIDNFEEFKAGFDKDGKKPKLAVFYYLIGVLEYVTGDKKQGDPMITLTLPKDYCTEDPASPSGFRLPKGGEGFFVEHMLESPNIVKSYVGGNPDNNYEIDKDNLEIHVIGKAVKDKYAIIDIQSGGKDIYSRVKLKKNKVGIWKLYATSSIATGVQVTTEEVDDF